MARKGSQSKNGVNRNIANHRNTLSDSVEKEKSEMHDRKVVDGGRPNDDHQFRSSSPIKEGIGNMKGSGKRSRQRSGNVPCREKSDDKNPDSLESVHLSSKTTDPGRSDLLSNDSEPRGDGGTFFGSNCSQKGSMSCTSDGIPAENVIDNNRFSNALSSKNIRTLASYVLEVAVGWLERQKPWFSTFTAVLRKGHSFVRGKLLHACPIMWTWTLYFGKLAFLLSMIWLDCSIRGLDSLLRLGTTSFFTVLWCSILSLSAMIGFTKMFVVMVIAALAAVFIGFGLAILIFATFALAILWLYGSFWTTGLVIFLGGITFALSHERIALLIATIYSMYCALSYVGWLGLVFGLNLSFISSDVLIHFLKKNINDQTSNDSQDDTRQSHGKAGYFYAEAFDSSPAGDACQSASDRSPDVPSTSGADTELNSEDEVTRLLNCTDHYSALGLARYANIDVSFLKREYRKKAMLVHPDKNMGNEKAAEAFKTLQNAYEVLLDSVKRKTYDDELRREELLSYLRRFQNASQKKGRHGMFRTGSSRSGMEDEGLHGESRRIACKKCSDFHVWIFTGRPKSQARWCQECKDFHHAKDGDGWVEQAFQPLLFGLMQKMDPPCAYVCSESRIYDATEWFVCQGMRCPANTHRPSFHVNTNLSSKPSPPSKGTSSAHRDHGGMPSSANVDETMTEEEFFEWFQNAMQSGMFESSGTSNESPSARNVSSSKSGVKKKRKGKRQW